MTQRTLTTLYGQLNVPNWSEDLIIKSLEGLGEWGAAEAILASGVLEAGETLWDAGAFLGTFSLGVAARTLPSKVIAIEANTNVCPALRQNLKLLPCPAMLVAGGLGARSGWLAPCNEDSLNHGATHYHYTNERQEGISSVRCRNLAELRAEHGPYDMLKLDLEGMELEAIRGDAAFLKLNQPVVWAECNEDKSSLELLSGLKWLNYQVLYIAFPAFRSANFAQSSDLIYPMVYEAALVAGSVKRLERLASQASALIPGEDILCRSIHTKTDLRKALYDTPRWSKKEWAALSRAELISKLGRVEKGIDLSGFLT